jgi:hypothetical protein
MRVSGQSHTRAPLPVNVPVNIYKRLGGPQGLSEEVRKTSPLLPGFDPGTVQPVASPYTQTHSPTNLDTTLNFWTPKRVT